jgi:hypothetical protein
MKFGSAWCRASLRATRNMEWVAEPSRAVIWQVELRRDTVDMSAPPVGLASRSSGLAGSGGTTRFAQAFQPRQRSNRWGHGCLED